MTVRRPDLEEWFLVHQLRALGRRHFHLPVRFDADVTALVAAWDEAGQPVPVTAVLARALGLWARRRPEVNRMVFDTVFGLRVVDFPYVNVNVPVLIRDGDRPHLSACIVRDADRCTVAEIEAQIRAARERRLQDLPVGRIFAGNRNTLWNRLRLRLIHFLVYNVPQLYVRKGGGGLSLSTLMRRPDPALHLRAPSYGPTAVTVFAHGIRRDGARALLELDIGFDHYALPGHIALDAVMDLGALLAHDGLRDLGPG